MAWTSWPVSDAERDVALEPHGTRKRVLAAWHKNITKQQTNERNKPTNATVCLLLCWSSPQQSVSVPSARARALRSCRPASVRTRLMSLHS